MKEGDNLKAIGITSSGKIREFEITSYGILYCYNEDLLSLEIPSGIKLVYCYNNLLTELILPEGVKFLNCNNNLLTKLTIPNTLKILHCDRNVLGLDNIDWDCDITLF